MKAVLMSIKPYWVFLIIAKIMGWNIDKEKTVEVRKSYPKDENWDKVVKIYCSKDKKSFAKIPKEYQPLMQQFLGKVIGEFVCDSIADYEAELWDDKTFERIQEFYEPDDFSEYGEYEYKTIATNEEDDWKENKLCRTSCLTVEELRKYLGAGITIFHGLHISDLVIYDKPKELSEFIRICPEWKKGKLTNKCLKCEHRFINRAECYVCCDCEGELPITWPPQSWCYVEEMG